MGKLLKKSSIMTTSNLHIARERKRIQAYVSSIQHENLTSYGFVVDSSQILACHARTINWLEAVRELRAHSYVLYAMKWMNEM